MSVERESNCLLAVVKRTIYNKPFYLEKCSTLFLLGGTTTTTTIGSTTTQSAHARKNLW